MTAKFMPTFMLLLLGCIAGSSAVIQSSSKGLFAQVPPTSCSSGNSQSTSPNNLNVSTASYLSQIQASEGTAIDIAPDCAVIIAGRYTNQGVVQRLNSSGTQLLSTTYVGSRVDDMEISRSGGQIAVVGDFGLALLNQNAGEFLWQKAIDPGTIKRVSIGTDGTIAVLSGNRVTTFDINGNLLKNWVVPSNGGWFVSDVAVDGARKSVFVTGFYNDRLSSGGPVQVPYLIAYDYSGDQKWALWAYSGSVLKGNEADSRGYRVAMGRDNKLYFQGEAAGGNSVFRWQPGKLNVADPNTYVKFDRYNDTYNTKSNHITYYARIDPTNGKLLKGQFALTRLTSGRGNTLRHGNITADEEGNVYVVGVATARIANRDQQQIAGKPVGPYAGGEGYLLVVSPDFSQRKRWTVWTGGNGTPGQNSRFLGVAARGGIAAVVGTVRAQGPLITHAAIRSNPSPKVSNDYPVGFFSVFPGY